MTSPPWGPIAYCTNVHAGRTLDETLRNLERHATRVRELLDPSQPLPIGLWLASSVADELAANDGSRALRDRLDAMGLAVVTLNGFPYGDFHDDVVKRAVYEPNWSTRERVRYTLRLAQILVDLLPPAARDASISTLPVGWRAALARDSAAMSASVTNLATVATELAALEDRTGIRIHVDLEPEPGCVLDTSADLVEFLSRCADASRASERHLGVCHDVCHAAVMFERQADAISRYRRGGIRVGKVQVSSALVCDGSDAALRSLAAFDERRYLHQTSVRDGSGRVRFFEDLPDALSARLAGEYRTHFHVPVHLDRIGELGSTRHEISECLAALRDSDVEGPITLEVETYAWNVLPTPLRPRELAEGIAEELRFVRGLVA